MLMSQQRLYAYARPVTFRDFELFAEIRRVVDFDAQVAHYTFQRGVTCRCCTTLPFHLKVVTIVVLYKF